MLAILVVLLILKLITLIRLEVTSVWELILKCNFAYFLTPSKVIQQFGKVQEVCRRKIIEQNLVVIAELLATLCKNRLGTAEWLLPLTAENVLYSDGWYTGCITVIFNKALPLPWSTCFGTRRVAQWIDLLPTQYIHQEQRSLVRISSVATWSFPPWASSTDELAKTLRKVQQHANSRAVAFANWTSEKVSARLSLSEESNKGVINQISTGSQGAYLLTVVALEIALVALALTIVSFVLVYPILRLFWAAMVAVLFNKPLRCTYTNHIEDAANRVRMVIALREKHKRIEYRACLTQYQTLKPLKRKVTLILHITGMARLGYGH